MKNKTLCIILSGAMIAGILAGCSSPGTATSGNTSSGSDSTSVASADEGVTLNDDGTVTFPESYPKSALKTDDEATLAKKVNALVAAMTQEEKFSFLGGSGTGTQGDAGTLPGVPRLGIPQMRMYDGPAGVLSLYDTTNPPIEQLLAATWDTKMAEGYGTISGSENKDIGGNTQLGAQVDITRNPYFGRAKDQMGEDPYLLSKLATAETKGINDQNVVTVLKHFVGFAQDATPATNTNIKVSEQALHELYMPAFEAAIRDGGAGAVMSSYNMINGTFTSSSDDLLNGVLRTQWGFRGYTITDWGGNDGFTLNKGTDIEMPNANSNSQEAAQALIDSGDLSQSTIDDAVKHVLTAYGEAGYLGLVQLDSDGSVMEEKGRTDPIELKADTAQLAKDRETNSQIALQMAEEGGVLLKNEDNTLPLSDKGSVAVVGLGGSHLISGVGGERSYGTISEMKSPAAALSEIIGEKNVDAQVGIDKIGTTIPAENLFTSADGTENGAVRTYGIAGNEGTAQDVQGQMKTAGQQDEQKMGDHEIGESTGITDETIDFTTGTIDGEPNKTWKNDGADKGTATAFTKDSGACYTWTTYIEAPEDGEYSLIFEGIGGSANANIEVSADNTISLGIANVNQGTQWPSDTEVCTDTGMDIVSETATLQKGQRYKVTVTAAAQLDEKDLQLRLAWITPSQKQENYNNAIKAAQTNDTTVVFGYTHNDGTAENVEDCTLALSDDQEQLILDCAKAAHDNGHKVVVVLNNDTAVTMENWIDQVDGILEMYYPGQEGGTATAELLTGKVNPSGKLAYTIPKKDTDTMVTISQAALDSQDIEEQGAAYTDEDYEKEVKMGRYASIDEAKQAMGEYRTLHSADYSEGILTGYRWYDANDIDPQYDFGYGLSYTTFEYSDLSVKENAQDGEDVGYDVTFTVTNTGDVSGTEIAQVYLGQAQVPDGIQSAKYQLCAYDRIEDLAPGESKTVTLHVNQRSLSYWNSNAPLTERTDGTQDKWTVATGTRTVYVGPSSDNLTLQSNIDVE